MGGGRKRLEEKREEVEGLLDETEKVMRRKGF